MLKKYAFAFHLALIHTPRILEYISREKSSILEYTSKSYTTSSRLLKPQSAANYYSSLATTCSNSNGRYALPSHVSNYWLTIWWLAPKYKKAKVLQM